MSRWRIALKQGYGGAKYWAFLDGGYAFNVDG
jgi:hypothetical protein